MSSRYPSTIHLEPHATARAKATAAQALQSGSIIASILSLSTSLLPSEKGRRCDGCHQLSVPGTKLRKCSGCISYWYCGVGCQAREWKAHHRKICKPFSRYAASSDYLSLSPHDKTDALLLSQLLAEVISENAPVLRVEEDDSIATFTELMQGLHTHTVMPPLCGRWDEASREIAKDLFLRFGNNNFILHSHLDSYAHGIFPLASRLFNHSCVPNAATKYIITPSEPVRMEVIALRAIAQGEEITIPYLDPALPFQTRQDALQVNYGFTCTCPMCSFSRDLVTAPPPARGTSHLQILEADLRRLALGSQDRLVRPRADLHCFEHMSNTLYPLLHETYLPIISEEFSRTSHEGPYEDAVSIGLTLLALYIVLYPVNYPQIGMHALELAKTAWNATVTPQPDGTADELSRVAAMEETARSSLALASQVLDNFGPEGDDEGPLAEIAVMQGLLSG